MQSCFDIIGFLSKKFDTAKSVRTAMATCLTHVPSVAPYGYLNIVFNPLSPDKLQLAASQFNCPDVLLSFWHCYNGLRLFFSAFSVYGVIDEDALVDRTDYFAYEPFSIAAAIREARRLPGWNENLFPVGWYGYDGSHAFLKKSSLSIHCFEATTLRKERCVFPTFQSWLKNEIDRIASLYSRDGILQYPPEATLPAQFC